MYYNIENYANENFSNQDIFQLFSGLAAHKQVIVKTAFVLIYDVITTATVINNISKSSRGSEASASKYLKDFEM